MLAELLQGLSSRLRWGWPNAGAIVLCLARCFCVRRMHVGRETAISLVWPADGARRRGAGTLLHGNLLVGALMLLAMTFAAAVFASRRARGQEAHCCSASTPLWRARGPSLPGILATEDVDD
jgi:hypothetical protein